MSDKKQSIIDTAYTLFVEQGYKSTSIQNIADHAGISKGAVYLYFSSKNDILLAVFYLMENKVWDKINAIKSDSSLTARQKFKGHLICYYEDVAEHIQFSQQLFQDAGLAITDELMQHIKGYRYRIQQAHEQVLLAVYGDEIKPWLSDITIVVNGMLHEFETITVFDKLQFANDNTAEFICQVTDHVVKGFLTQSIPSMLTDKLQQVRANFFSDTKSQFKQAVKKAIEQLNDQALALKLTDKDKQLLQETLSMLSQAVQEDAPNKVLLKALLASLADHKELLVVRKELGKLLEVPVS